MTEDDYSKRVLETYKAQTEVLWDLLLIAQRLAPGFWPLQLLAYPDGGTEKHQRKFVASVSNGDDNITAMGKTPGAAVALLIHYLLNGSVFPITGNGGSYYVPDFEDTPAGKRHYAILAAVKDDSLTGEDLRHKIKSILNSDID